LDVFGSRIGPYPYDTVTVVYPPVWGGAIGGMEYPTLFTGIFVDPIFDVDPLPENEIFIDVFADFFTPVWNTAEDGPILGVRFELDVESSSDIEGVFFTITSFPFGFADGFQSFAPSFEDDFETIVAEFPIGQGFNGDPDFFTNNGPEFSFGFAFSRSVFDFSETGFLDPDYEGDQFLATFDNFRVLIITESGCSPADLVPPFGVISQADVAEFVSRFFANDPRVAVLAPPTDVVSQADVAEFVNLFFAGCPAG
ncbi:MAG: hypothetical protein AAFU70_10605, partial [Planctomycetota bacterium]